MPGKHRVRLQSEIIHHIDIGIDIVLTTTAHLVLSCFQKVYHFGFFIKLGIDGQCLYRHTDRMQESFVRSAIIDGGKQRLLLIVVFRQ